MCPRGCVRPYDHGTGAPAKGRRHAGRCGSDARPRLGRPALTDGEVKIRMRLGFALLMAGEWGTESNGRAFWRIMTGAPPGGLRREEARLRRPERAMHPAAAVALAAVAALTLVVDPGLLLWLAGLFGLAYLLQRAAG